MNILLDTHAFVWAIARSDRLSERALALIRDPEHTVWVSAVTAYEIEFNRARDGEIARLPADLDEIVAAQGYAWLALGADHATLAGRLPRLHGDPFDRMLAAQSLIEQATVLTRDPLIAIYGAVVAW